MHRGRVRAPRKRAAFYHHNRVTKGSGQQHPGVPVHEVYVTQKDTERDIAVQ